MVQQQNTAKQASFSHHGLKMDCRFDAAGKLRQRTDSTTEGSHVYSYAYDARGRLTTVHKDSREVERYAYNTSGQSVMRSSYLRHCAGSSKCELHYDSRGRLLPQIPTGASKVGTGCTLMLPPVAKSALTIFCSPTACHSSLIAPVTR